MRVTQLFVAMAVIASSTVSLAEPLNDNEMYVTEPTGMNDRAVHKAGKIPWCEGKYTLDIWDKGRLRRAIQSGGLGMTGTTWADGVEHMCQWADDPTWQKQATYVIQDVMNANKSSQDEALDWMKKFVAKNKSDRANEGKPQSDEDRFAFTEHTFNPAQPEQGVGTAKVSGTIPWCDKAGKITDRWDPGRIHRTIDSRYGIQGTIEGALHLCQRPTDASWKQQATYVLQKWMNWTKQTQADAEQSLRARIQLEKFKADGEALCKQLELDPEVSGQDKSYGEAHRNFFGCGGRDGEEAWRADNLPMGDTVAFYLDADNSLDSEIVRMYWLFTQTRTPDQSKLPSKDSFDNLALLQYAVASQDFANIDAKALEKQLAKAPFNVDYARVIVNESASILKWRRNVYEAAIDKLGKSGSEYTDILREAPKKAFAQWGTLTSMWKAELDRSYAFEKKLSLPSRKALQGCSKELMPDAQKLIKSYKTKEYNALVNKVSTDPIATLLLGRLAVCFAAEKVLGGSGALKDLVRSSRDLRGPRSLAYYMIVDALATALKDRPKLVLSMSNFYFRMGSLVETYDNEFNFSGAAPREPEKAWGKGFVKEVKKTGDGLQVVFKTQKLKYPEYNCVSTGRPIRIRDNGQIEYEQNCTATGKMLSQDQTPSPMTISPLLATGVKAGAYVVGDASVIAFVKKKGEDKQILTFFGFAL